MKEQENDDNEAPEPETTNEQTQEDIVTQQIQEDTAAAGDSSQPTSPRDSRTEDQTEECPAEDVDVNEETGEQATGDEQHHQSEVEESHNEPVDPAEEDKAMTPHCCMQRGTSEQSQSAAVDDMETNHSMEEQPAEHPVTDVDQLTTTTTPTKPEQKETKTACSRPKNATTKGVATRKTWKPAGPVGGAPPSQQNGKAAMSAGSSSRAKASRQANGAAPTRLPPISGTGMTGNDKRRQPGPASADAKNMDALSQRRNTDTNTLQGVGTGRQYKCSATAFVTVLYQPPEDNTEQQSPDNQAPDSGNSSDRNRKYNSATTTRMNGDRLPLVVADKKNLTSHASIVDGGSLRIVVDGFRVPQQRNDVISGGDDPVSVRIDVAMTTGGGRVGRRQDGYMGTAYRQNPIFPVQRLQLQTTNRDVIATRAIGPAFAFAP